MARNNLESAQRALDYFEGLSAFQKRVWFQTQPPKHSLDYYWWRKMIKYFVLEDVDGFIMPSSRCANCNRAMGAHIRGKCLYGAGQFRFVPEDAA